MTHHPPPPLRVSADGSGGQSGSEWEAHAAKAHETDALRTLYQLTSHAGLTPNAAEMFNNIVLRCGVGLHGRSA